MNMETKNTFKCAIALFILLGLIISIPIGVWVIKSKFEANAYNRITDSDVSTWDAMWVQLRVDGGSK